MKKQLFLIILCLVATLPALAQPVVTVGAPYAVVDATSKYYFKRGTDIFTVKVAGKKIFLQKINSDKMELVSENMIPNMPSGYVLESILMFGNKLNFFYSLYDKPNKTEQLFSQELDIDNCTFKGAAKLIVKVDGKIDPYNKFTFNSSFDTSKLLVTYRRKPEIKDDSKNFDVIGMNIFDKDMKVISQGDIVMPYTEKMMNNIDYSIDSEGNAYTLATVYEEGSEEKRQSKRPYHYELLKLKPNDTKFEIIPFMLPDKFINRIWLYESKGNMVCAGFYSNIKNSDDVNGIVLCQVGRDNKIKNFNTYEIPVDILNQNVSERTQKRNQKKEDDDKAEFEELELRQMLVQQDGSILLIGEQYYVVTHTVTTSSGTRTYYTYHYNDILITKIDAAGKLSWMKKLPKRQMGTSGRGGMSFKYVSSGTDHYLVYLDNEKNMDLGVNEVPALHKDATTGGIMTAYKIADKDGTTTKIRILDMKNVEGMELYQFNVGRIINVNSNQFLFEVYKKKKEDVLIKVKF